MKVLDRFLLHHAKIRITGIDVQAELRAKGGSPNLGPTRMPVSTAPLTQPIQRYAVNKYAQNRRSLGNIPKSSSPTQAVNISPNIRPQPTSGISSPTVSAHHRSPNFLPQQNGPMSPAFGPSGQQIRPHTQQVRPQFQPPPRPSIATAGYPSSASTINSAVSAASSGPNPNQVQQNPNSFYNSPFQNHYDQLGKYKSARPHSYEKHPPTRYAEQEYDDGDDMYDDDANDHPTSAGAYQNNFAIPGQSMQPPQPPGNHHPQHMGTNGHALQPQPPQHHQDGAAQFGAAPMNTGYDFSDPMLDADPFGLSASMHFPTQFSFDAVSR